ncbi:MAG TPA: nucleotide exchange factor GrpE [Solirubrobacterales bacterium]|jgi:molecular chaperone GrpE|nr:nucleotide exchange factor GrpE [Solirubrobacterales bacterium]
MTHHQDGSGTDEPRPAGPVAAGDPPPPATAQEGVPPTTPPTGEAEESGAREVEEDFDALLADAKRERDEYLELAKRTKADFENYRKRVAADVQAAQARGKAEVARGLIDAVDNLERALESAESDEGLVAGVEMVLNGLREALSRNGIEVVDPKGEKFDPTQHEALSTMPVEGAESGIVVEVMQKGYALDGQLIRPARVVVSS